MSLSPDATTEQADRLNRLLVDKLKQYGVLGNPAVEDAFRTVLRHHFLPGVSLESVYEDRAASTKYEGGIAISSSSQPLIMAVMLDQLDVRPGQRALEIGTGTGYNAALLGRLVTGPGHVVSVDLDQDLVDAARVRAAASGVSNVEFVCADGAYGWRAGAPYDRVVLTVSSADVSPDWLAQLRPDGRLLIPLTLTPGYDKSVAFERRGDHLESLSLRDCGFMSMRGAFAPVAVMPRAHKGVAPGVQVSAHNPAAVWRLLQTPARRHSVVLGGGGLWNLRFWIALWAPDAFCAYYAEPGTEGLDHLPVLLGRQAAAWWFGGVGLATDRGVCLLHLEEGDSFEIWEYGDDPDLAGQLRELLARPQPPESRLRVAVHSAGFEPEAVPGTGQAVLHRRLSTLVVTWPAR